MESVDSSNKLLVSGSSGYVNNQEQDAIIKTITSRAPSGEEGYTKENEITVINFDKSKQVVCEICLEKHKKARHSDDDTCFYCSE